MRQATFSIPILFEDNHLLVVEKPVNMPSQGDASKDPDLLSILKEDIKIRYQKPGNVYLGLVHRLDRPVGGVMVFAKTSKAASRLSEQIRTRTFGKAYLVVVHKTPNPQKGRLEHYLAKNRATNTVQIVKASTKEGKQAILEYKVLEVKDMLSLVYVELLTGRSHQIRVQFSAIGHPLYGDQKYGAHVNKPGQQISLWSHEIRFLHPTTKEEMIFHSQLPAEHPWSLFSAY
ncbi:MAG TPA: RNA pseudouridine synthase [Clostridiales bacterium]|nr:RluA family pseudouridine synthase [Clostridia bacterium]MDD4680458.1 RluA family pseudouridine synthase [Clostridia bacterium]HCS72886.1 RNA pseudouridine synthase [Clostridiales bacterium]